MSEKEFVEKSIAAAQHFCIFFLTCTACQLAFWAFEMLDHGLTGLDYFMLFAGTGITGFVSLFLVYVLTKNLRKIRKMQEKK